MSTLKKRRTGKLCHLDVTVYTTPGCTGCPKTLRILRDHHIPHTIIDLSTDKAAYQYVTQNLQYRQAPVVKVHNGWEQATWSGHRPELIAEFILQYYNPMKQPTDAAGDELYAVIDDPTLMHDNPEYPYTGIDMANPATGTPVTSSYGTSQSTSPHFHAEGQAPTGWQINKKDN